RTSMSGRCWRVLMAVMIGAAPAGCRTIFPPKEARTEPIAQLVPPADGKDDQPPPELPPKDAARACLACAEEMEKHGNEVQAILFYEKARHDDPKSKVSRRLAVLYDRQGDFQKAQEEYRKALKKTPRDADLLNDMGYGYYSRGRWTEAENYLRQALAAQPEHTHSTMNLGLCVGIQGRYDEARQLFTKVVTPAQVECNLAFLYTINHKWQQARQAYQAALHIDPDIPMARAALAKLEKAEREPSKQVQTAQAPPKPEGNGSMGYVQFEDSNDKPAVRQAANWTPASGGTGVPPVAHP
ncbi:MAG: tetratricopeptide repeat protein, partial [Gemmataceae bacterium]